MFDELLNLFKRLVNLKQLLQFVFVVVIFIFASLVLSKFLYENFFKHYFFDNLNHLKFIISCILASFFPISAIAYVLFQRETQRRKLARGFWLLGIDVKGDLDEKDLLKIKKHLNGRNWNNENWNEEDWDVEAYGEYLKIFDKRSNVSWNYVAQSIPAILATTLGLSLFINLGNIQSDLVPPEEMKVPLEAMQFGFLGAYIFSIQLVYRRYTTLDLQPTVYMNCTLTMISGIVFNFVAFEAINALNNVNATESASGLTGGIVAIVAFSLGYFPYLAIRWFNQVGYRALGLQERSANALPLSLIDGISQFHETRLRDEGIDNLQNLASAAIEELLIKTHFTVAEVISWVDQAILYLYLDRNEIEIFRRGGIRCFTDLQDYWGPYFKAYHTIGKPTRKLIESFRHSETFSELNRENFLKTCKEVFTQLKEDPTNYYEINGDNNLSKKHKNLLTDLDEDRRNIAFQLKATADYLDALYLATKTGPNVAHIKHYWHNVEDIANTNRQRLNKKRRQQREQIIKKGQKHKDIHIDNYLGLLEDYEKSLDNDTWKVKWELEDKDKRTQVYFHLGVASEAKRLENLNLAEKAYNKAIEIAPDYSEPYNALAWFYYKKQGELEKALIQAEKAVSLATDEEGKFYNLDELLNALDTLIEIKILLAKEKTNPTKKESLLDDATKELEKIKKIKEEEEANLVKGKSYSLFLALDTLVKANILLAEQRTNPTEKVNLLDDAEEGLEEIKKIITESLTGEEQERKNILAHDLAELQKYRTDINEQRSKLG